jgi:hypothetical protein
MKTVTSLVCLLALLASAAFSADAPEFPKPTEQHEWLQQLVGEWTTAGECEMEPGNKITSKGAEKVRSLGGFWIIGEGEAEVLGMKMQTQMTLGYDPKKEKFVGTFIDNITGTFWLYEGELDSAGKKLTLSAEGPRPDAPDTTAKFRDVIEIKDKNHRTLTSFIEQDGKWVQMMTAEYTRTK